MGNAYYETADMLINRINMYFERLHNDDGNIQISDSMTLKKQKPTITGLALFLGYSSVSAFKNQSMRSDEFADAVAYGHLLIENHYEHLLQTEKLTKAGEVGLRRVGEWREAIDVTVGGGSSHNIYIGEAIKRWQELRAKRQSSSIEESLPEPDSQLSLSTTSATA
jgi:hypothetical protein